MKSDDLKEEEKCKENAANKEKVSETPKDCKGANDTDNKDPDHKKSVLEIKKSDPEIKKSDLVKAEKVENKDKEDPYAGMTQRQIQALKLEAKKMEDKKNEEQR